MRPVLWNVYIDDLFHQLSAVNAYAYDCTFSLSYCLQDSQRAVAAINKQLKAVEEWGKVWQVDFAPNGVEWRDSYRVREFTAPSGYHQNPGCHH